jgi:hypothetical protein
MDKNLTEIVVKTHLKQMSDRLDRAASLGKAAVSCAETGNISKGVEIALDIEQIVYEVTTILNAASMINRVGAE